MAYFNDIDDASFYFTSSASSEPEVYPFLGRMSAIGGGNIQSNHTIADPWSMMGKQPSRLIDPPAGLPASYGEYCCSLFID